MPHDEHHEKRDEAELRRELGELEREEKEIHREEAEIKRELEEREHHDLHIFVNRRKFERGDGVKREMTGREIAGLVGVPPENAVVRYDLPHEKKEIGIDQVVHIKNGEHFLVTRKIVEGGFVA
jgi:Multiubiquitin